MNMEKHEEFSITPTEKIKPVNETERIMSHGEKTERGGEGVVNTYKAKGMYNRYGEYISDVSVQRTKAEPYFINLPERRN